MLNRARGWKLFTCQLSETFYLFFDVWSDVESPDDGAHVLGLTHGSKTGNAATDHKNFRRRDFAGSSDLQNNVRWTLENQLFLFTS